VRGRPARHRLVQHGEQAPFERRRPRHADGKGRARGAQRTSVTRHREQLRRVVGGRGAARQHAVVARPLALESQAAHRHPSGGMEPVERAGRGAGELRQVVVARHVRELVEKRGAEALRRPSGGVLGEDDDRAPGAPGDGCADRGARAQLDRPAHARRRSGLGEERAPRFVIQRCRGTSEPAQAEVTGETPQHDGGDARRPHHAQPRGGAESAPRGCGDGGGRTALRRGGRGVWEVQAVRRGASR